MSISPETIRSLGPELTEQRIEEHFRLLDSRYFDTFGPREIVDHLRALSRTGPDNPVEILIQDLPDGQADCTILGFDYPAVFSIIAGVLTAHGFSIISGEVFTYRKHAEKSARQLLRRRYARRSGPPSPGPRRRIIDHFRGVFSATAGAVESISSIRDSLRAVMQLLEKGDRGLAEARQYVNEAVAGRLRELHLDSQPFLLPLELSFEENAGPFTRLRVVGQDTPAFLYALSSALSLQGISIERISIQTSDGLVEDHFELVDNSGNRLDESQSPRITLAALLTKQFTYFLGNAPDPYRALMRFEQLIADITALPERAEWISHLSNPRLLQDLARLLGISDYLWEDFIRGQYEHILPLLSPEVRTRGFSRSAEQLRNELLEISRSDRSYDDKTAAINALKDHQIFHLDLEHILSADASFHRFSERLTGLAESVVDVIAALAYAELAARFGKPLSVAGIEASYAVFGLGKLGGAALGYASDIELLFVYSDSGSTAGPRVIDNAEFFDRFVKTTVHAIRAKREGIFMVDLRLRPYGKDGPLASSLANFIRYYGPGGAAHSYERLALVRLRAIAGNRELGARVERLRDQYVYGASLIVPAEIQQLRQRQFEEKNEPGLLNAKYSPGGLVDIEYDVQLMQVLYGRDHAALRTPRIHRALRALCRIGVLSDHESGQLAAAYDFLRDLINGLRMLRGSARDLFLPRAEHAEFAHLARRMGYRRDKQLTAAQQLHVDFATHTAVVRRFVERHFGRQSLPDGHVGNVADLILRDAPPEEAFTPILRETGFDDPHRAVINLRELGGLEGDRNAFARLAVLAVDMLRNKPDPDMALNNWERFVRARTRSAEHYELMLAQPARLDILLSIFSGSQFLANILIQNPLFLDWTTKPEIIHAPRNERDLLQELEEINASYFAHDLWLDALRLYRNREILRIGARDICFKAPIEEITADLSLLARSTVETILRRTWKTVDAQFRPLMETCNPAEHFCIMALGKLGGNELNYSSDIDLLAVCDNQIDLNATVAGNSWLDLLAHVMSRVRADLATHTAKGRLYRVDLRLRPYGKTGQLVYTEDRLVRYYSETAAAWERQALLKLWPIAGALAIGARLRDRLLPAVKLLHDPVSIGRAIEKMRERSRKRAESAAGIDVKNGRGSIRDIEFTVQGLQLAHLRDHTELYNPSTLKTLDLLLKKDIVSRTIYTHLREDYIFLRRVEHFLQILNDLQTHTLSAAPAQTHALAKRLLGSEASGNDLQRQLIERMERTHATFQKQFARFRDGVGR